MENPNHKIEEIFQQRLRDVEVSPPPFVWPAVERELQKRRRRWVLWFFVFGTMATGAWLWQSKFLPERTPGTASAQTGETKKFAQQTSIPAQSETQNKGRGDVAKEPQHPTTAQPVHPAQLPESLIPKKSGSGSLVSPKGSETSSIPFSKPSALPSASEEAINLKPTTNDQQPTTNNQQPTTYNPQTIGLDLLPALSRHGVASKLLPDKSFSIPKVKPHSRRKKTQPKLCYDFARHPSAWLVDVYAGPSLAQRSLTSRLDDRPYLNQRLATEQRDLAMNAGLRASLMFNRNFLVRTGLHYDQVTEVFEFIDPTSVTYILRFNDGDPIPDTLGVQYGENYLKTYNRYRMLDVPLMAGMEMRRGRSGFSINAGLSVNVLFKKSGVIIDPLTQEPARFGPIPDKPKGIGPNAILSQDVFRANVGLSAVASIQWYWHLTPRMRVFAEPTFRQVLRPISVGSHPVEHRYSIIGLRLGATKIF